MIAKARTCAGGRDHISTREATGRDLGSGTGFYETLLSQELPPGFPSQAAGPPARPCLLKVLSWALSPHRRPSSQHMSLWGHSNHVKTMQHQNRVRSQACLSLSAVFSWYRKMIAADRHFPATGWVPSPLWGHTALPTELFPAWLGRSRCEPISHSSLVCFMRPDTSHPLFLFGPSVEGDKDMPEESCERNENEETHFLWDFPC